MAKGEILVNLGRWGEMMKIVMCPVAEFGDVCVMSQYYSRDL